MRCSGSPSRSLAASAAGCLWVGAAPLTPPLHTLPLPPLPPQSAGALVHLLLLTGAVGTLLVAAGVLALGDLTPTLGDLRTALRGEWGGGCELAHPPAGAALADSPSAAYWKGLPLIDLPAVPFPSMQRWPRGSWLGTCGM